jgi:hypothetical protein
MKPELEFLTKTIYEPEVFWAMLVAVATVILTFATVALVFVGAIPLVRAKKADSRRDFARSCWRQKLRKLFFLVSHGFLEFVRRGKRR